MRVALLARVSKDEKGEGSVLSLPAQLRAMRARCQREGWQIVAEYTAPGESAYTADLRRRPVLLEAVVAAEAGAFDLLMTHESSRFARNALLALEVQGRLTRAGVHLLDDAARRLEPATAESGFRDTINFGVNEYWSAKMGEHIRKVKRELFEMGLHLGDPPFGYARTGPREPLAVVPDEAAAVREGFRDYVAGASYTEIAAQWNARGLRTRSKQGHTQFTVPAMQTIFENDFYAGFVRHHAERRVGAHEALISEDLWLAAQSRVNRRGSRARHRRALSGVASCVECGGPVWLTSHGKKGHTIYYYREASKERGRACVNSGSMWRADEVEEGLDRVMVTMGADAAWLKRVERASRKAPVADSGERERLQAERRRATNAYMAAALAEEEWRSRLAVIDGRLSRLAPVMPGGVVFAGERLASVSQLWGVMDVDDRREACRILFEAVSLDTRGHGLWLRPWPEFEPYFTARRDAVVSLLGPPGFEPRTNRL